MPPRATRGAPAPTHWGPVTRPTAHKNSIISTGGTHEIFRSGILRCIFPSVVVAYYFRGCSLVGPGGRARGRATCSRRYSARAGAQARVPGQLPARPINHQPLITHRPTLFFHIRAFLLRLQTPLDRPLRRLRRLALLRPIVALLQRRNQSLPGQLAVL